MQAVVRTVLGQTAGNTDKGTHSFKMSFWWQLTGRQANTQLKELLTSSSKTVPHG
jgi:hypothetical protein